LTAPGPYSLLPPPQPAGAGTGGRGRQILLSLIPFLSGGVFTFVPFLYLATVRRRRRDWLICAGYMLAVILTGVAVTALPHNPGQALAGSLVVLLIGGGTVHSFAALRPGAMAAARVTQQVEQQAEASQYLALQAARNRIRQRAEVRKLVADNPTLARELRVGRPDLPRNFDDGGLVDVNHVGPQVLAWHLGLAPAEAQAVIAARDQLGRFTSCAEMSTYASLHPDRLDSVTDLIYFG
jgi:DNA uptake protein ComE-like DNA-binding protein